MTLDPGRAICDLSDAVHELEHLVEAAYNPTGGVDAYNRLKTRRHTVKAARQALDFLRRWRDDPSQACPTCADRARMESPGPDSCTCFLGHAPCGWCVGQYECPSCGELSYNPDAAEGEVCEDCQSKERAA